MKKGSLFLIILVGLILGVIFMLEAFLYIVNFPL